MVWVERRAAGPSVATADAAGAGRSVEREAGLRFAGELAAGVVLRDELHVAVFEPAIRRLVLDAKVGQFEVAVDNRQAARRRQTFGDPTRAPGRPRAVGPVQKRLVVALQLVVEDDPVDPPAVLFDPSGFRLIEPIELGSRARVSRGLTRPA